jgi:positive regulator of sigma E activity
LPARILSGATLQIAIEPRRLVSLSLAVFLLPILLMLLSCVTCGAFVSHSSGAMSLAALLGLLVGSRLAASSVKRIIAGEDRALLTIAETSDEAR